MEHQADVEGIGMGVGEGGESVPAVILAVREQYVPIFVTNDQARSIELGLRGEPSERPLTHDIVVNIVTEFGGVVDKVRIDDLTDGTFYAKLDLVQYDDGESEKFVFDIRPSDGVALAVRADAPITVSDAVIDEAGRDPSELLSDDATEWPEEGIDELRERFEEQDPDE